MLVGYARTSTAERGWSLPPGHAILREPTDCGAALKHEAAKGKGANDSAIVKLDDGLVGLAPGATSAVVSAPATPILGELPG
jgi:hypothetical protein